MLVTKTRINELITEELMREHNSDSGMMSGAMKELVRALGLIESAADMLDRVGDSKVDGIVNNLMAMSENLYTQLQILKNADYDHEMDD